MRDLIRDALENLPRGECPDAALLAAYADRTLDRAERGSIDAHLAACDRCRDTLILMSRAAATDQPAEYAEDAKARAAAYAEHETAEYAEDAERADRRFILRRWPWLAGAAAAGLAVVIWAAAQQRESVSLPPPAKAAAQPSPAAVDALESKEEAPAGVARDERRRRDSAAPQKMAERLLADRDTKASAPASKAPAAAPPAPSPPGAAMPAPPPAAVAETVAGAPGAVAGRMAQRTGAESAPAVYRTGALISASAPDGRTIWRAWESGAIERSIDAGVMWTRESGIEAPGARAIAAPSPEVCWIAGRAGLILRYEAARGWTRVQAPAALDFVAVATADGRQATITAADGRRFSTADGGETWTRFE